MQRPAARLLGVFLAGWIGAAGVTAAATSPDQSPVSNRAFNANLQELRALLKTPEAQIDLAEAKVTIDHMIDPTIDVPATLKRLDALAAKVRSRFPAGASNRAKLDLLWPRFTSLAHGTIIGLSAMISTIHLEIKFVTS